MDEAPKGHLDIKVGIDRGTDTSVGVLTFWSPTGRTSRLVTPIRNIPICSYHIPKRSVGEIPCVFTYVDYESLERLLMSTFEVYAKRNPPLAFLRRWCRRRFGWTNRQFKRVRLGQIRQLWREHGWEPEAGPYGRLMFRKKERP